MMEMNLIEEDGNEPRGVKKNRFIIKDSEEVYRMKAVRRGPCLIINNQNFEYLGTRRGTEKDAVRLQALFQDLGFDVEVKPNLTTQQMRDSLNALAKDERNWESDAAVVAILTHGNRGYFCGTEFDPNYDKVNLTCDDIVYELNNVNCPSLRGKPKICFFQACSGERQSVGVEDDIRPAMTKVKKKMPEASDFLLSFAAQEGFTTVRFEDKGGIYINHLIDVLTGYADHRDLLDMLTMVERRVQATQVTTLRRLADGEQDFLNPRGTPVALCLSTSVKLLGWSRKLFFNPIEQGHDPEEMDLPNPWNFSKILATSVLQEASPRASFWDFEKGTKDLWVLGGSQASEVLRKDSSEWNKQEDTGLQRDQQIASNSQDVVVDSIGNVSIWSMKTKRQASLTRLEPARTLFAIAYHDGDLYIMGGEIANKAENSCQIFVSRRGTWISGPSLNRPTSGRTAVVLEGKIYVSPGRKNQALGKLDVLDPSKGSWTTVPGKMKVARYGQAILAHEKYIWIFGGNDGHRCLADVERFCPASGSWQKMESMTTPRSALSVSVFQGKFYAIGGMNDQNEVLNVVETYDSDKRIWEQAPSLCYARAQHSSAVLQG